MVVRLEESPGARRPTNNQRAFTAMQARERDRAQALGGSNPRYTQADRDLERTQGLTLRDARAYNNYLAGYSNQQAAAPPAYRGTGTSSGGGGRGGGGGGGGVNAAAAAQQGLDALLKIIGSTNYDFNSSAAAKSLDAQDASIRSASANDLAASNTAYDNLDAWNNANLRNPYQDLQFARAPTAPDYNRYLESQGVDPLNGVQQNPDDAYGGFVNAGRLLNANTEVMNQSTRAGSQQGRVATNAQIGAGENAFLNNVMTQRATAQAAMDAEKRQIILQLIPLLQSGAKAPADLLAQLGLA